MTDMWKADVPGLGQGISATPSQSATGHFQTPTRVAGMSA